MSKLVLMIAGVVVLLMALLASFSFEGFSEPVWHIVLKWIGGGLMVLVAYMDKSKST